MLEHFLLHTLRKSFCRSQCTKWSCRQNAPHMRISFPSIKDSALALSLSMSIWKWKWSAGLGKVEWIQSDTWAKFWGKKRTEVWLYILFLNFQTFSVCMIELITDHQWRILWCGKLNSEHIKQSHAMPEKQQGQHQQGQKENRTPWTRQYSDDVFIEDPLPVLKPR